MSVNDAYAKGGGSVADGADFILDGSNAGTGAAEVQEVFGDAAADIYREIDPDGDGTFEVSILMDRYNSNFHGQLNALLISQSENARIRINNTSGGAGSYGATGIQVND